MQKKKILFAGIVLLLLILAATAFYWYQKPRTSLANIKPDYTISATDLYKSFEQDENKANQQFLKKVILVTGTVDNVQVTDSTVSLLLSSGNSMGGINCSVTKSKNTEQTIPTKGATARVKGRCV